MQYDFQIFVQDYQWYHFAVLIIEMHSKAELNDRYHENNNDHFLSVVLKRNFFLMVDDDFDYYYQYHTFDWNDLLSKNIFIKN
jgi:hypothetical protein